MKYVDRQKSLNMTFSTHAIHSSDSLDNINPSKAEKMYDDYSFPSWSGKVHSLGES